MHSQLVEFRNYRLVPGGFDAFVEHFEDHFLESQEALGMDIVGQFRVVDDPERFVWIRRFREPSSRGASLAEFYEGPVWKEFGPRANELMVEYNDVYLLTPDDSAPAFATDHVPHAARDGRAVEPTSTVVAALFDRRRATALGQEMAQAMHAALSRRLEVSDLGRLVTADVQNDYPRLPIRKDVVALWLLSDEGGYGAAVATAEEVGQETELPMRTLRLAPTARSSLR